MEGKVVIGGQEYKTESNWGDVRRINKKYGLDVDPKIFDEYAADVLFEILVDNPFVKEDGMDYDMFFNSVSPEEMFEIEKEINKLLLGPMITNIGGEEQEKKQ